MKKLEDIISEVNDKLFEPLVDARFGDRWKDSWAAQNASIEELRETAWRQGRRAILLEREIEKLLNK